MQAIGASRFSIIVIPDVRISTAGTTIRSGPEFLENSEFLSGPSSPPNDAIASEYGETVIGGEFWKLASQLLNSWA
jgi:hypothetical protein